MTNIFMFVTQNTLTSIYMKVFRTQQFIKSAMASLCFLFLGFLVLSINGEMVMEEDELLGLFDVMGSFLDDPTWPIMHPQPCSDTPWPGLQCEVGDQNPKIFHVTKIHIGPDILNPPCKNSSRISYSILKLPFLKTLSLFNCFTDSPLFLNPSLFGAFSSLENLVLESNPGLSGKIPSSLGQVKSLRVLSLSQNNLQGDIPIEINGLVNLEQIDLSHNNLSGLIPEQIMGLEKLAILDLSFNGLQGHVPLSLGHLNFLEKIDLGSNKLEGHLPQELGGLEKLGLFDLSHNFISGPLPENLYGLKKLEYLILDENPINTEIPLFIGSLKMLKVFSCSNCGLVGPILPTLSNLKYLSALSLDMNKLEGCVPANLGALPNLEQLNLSYNELSGEVLLSEEFVKRLGKRLDLKGNNGLFMKHQIHKNKNDSSVVESPCLETMIPRFDGKDECKKMKPTLNQEKNFNSSYNHGLNGFGWFFILNFFLFVCFCLSF